TEKMNHISLLLLFTGFLFQSCNNITAEPPSGAIFSEVEEMEKIMKVIEGETSSFYKRDYESWKSFYIHTDYAFQAWSNGDGTFDANTGRVAVGSGIGNYIKTYPVEPEDSSHPIVF